MMPHRYYDYANITFTDGTTERVGGNREGWDDGVLTIWTASDIGGRSNEVKYSLSNIRSWKWEKGEA